LGFVLVGKKVAINKLDKNDALKENEKKKKIQKRLRFTKNKQTRNNKREGSHIVSTFNLKRERHYPCLKDLSLLGSLVCLSFFFHLSNCA